MVVKEFKDGKIINLSRPFDTRPKFLYGIKFFTFFVAATFFLRQLLVGHDLSIGAIIVLVLGVVAFYIAAYRFVNKAVMTEKLFVNRKLLQLINQGLFSPSTRTYDIAKISNFRHLERPQVSRHPLAGQTFDYLGFETEQRMINELHGDHRLAFDYEGHTITFGNNFYSWEFNELEILLFDITGNDFKYNDEQEKSFKSEE